MSDDIRRAVYIQPLNLYCYLHEEIYVSADEIANPNSAQREIDEAHYRTLAESSLSNNYDFTRFITTLLLLSTIYPEFTTYGTAAHNLNRIKLLKDSYYIVMLDGHCWRRFVEVWKDGNGIEWAANPMSISYELCVDEKHTSAAQAINLSKTGSVSSKIVRRDALFTHTMKSLLNYARPIKETYAVWLVDVCITDLVEDVISLNVLAASCRGR